MQSLHIVQVGFDDSVFDTHAPSDTLFRQLRYGRVLAQRHTGGRMTYVILTGRAQAYKFERENVTFLPVFVQRAWEFGRLWKALAVLHADLPITVLSPQNVNELGWITLLFGKLHAIPVVGQVHYDLFSPHAQDSLMGRGLRGWLKKRLMFFFLPRYTALRVVGEATRRELIARRLNYNVRVIPVPVTMLDEQPPPESPPVREQPRVIYVGRLSPEKNLGFWLEVAKRVCERHPTVMFDVIGEGAVMMELREQCRALGITERVQFLGSVPNNELTSHYRAASVFLLTSLFEGFGRVLVEACAHAVPVVAPKIHGVEDIIQNDKNGFLCAPGDESLFAEKVLQLLSDGDLRNRMGQWGARWVRNRFTPQGLIEQWVDWLLASQPDDWLIPPLRASVGRWWKLSSSKYSLLRSLEYERIEGLALRGRTIDIGGGEHNSYYHLLNLQGTVESVNIDPDIKPSVIADLNRGIPLASEVYDHVISFNTFEHVYRDELALQEAIRVLKSGGTFHIIVPFLYRVHASPLDFHRHTAYWWVAYLKSLGIPPDNVFVEPLLWDPAVTGFALNEFAVRFRGARKRMAMFPAVLRHLRWPRRQRVPLGQLSAWYAEYALGYYIYGKK